MCDAAHRRDALELLDALERLYDAPVPALGDIDPAPQSSGRETHALLLGGLDHVRIEQPGRAWTWLRDLGRDGADGVHALLRLAATRSAMTALGYAIEMPVPATYSGIPGRRHVVLDASAVAWWEDRAVLRRERGVAAGANRTPCTGPA
jgi:hypothetical protein